MGRKIILPLIVLVGLTAIALLIIPLQRRRELFLTGCFSDAHGLRANDSVQISGVDVGVATDVWSRPERKDCLAEVRIVITTPYDLKIPNDAVARVVRAGLLGGSMVQIDVREATGPPLSNHALVKTAPTL